MENIRISILGDKMVGKTLLINKLFNNKYDVYKSTIGVCFYDYYIYDNQLTLYDITSNIKNYNLINSYVKTSNAFIIIVDYLLSIDIWINIISIHHKNIPIIILFNNYISVSNDTLENFIKRLNELNILLITINLSLTNNETLEMVINQVYNYFIKNI